MPQRQQQRIADGEPLDEQPIGAVLPLPLLARREKLVDVVEALERAGARAVVERVAAIAWRYLPRRRGSLSSATKRAMVSSAAFHCPVADCRSSSFCRMRRFEP